MVIVYLENFLSITLVIGLWMLLISSYRKHKKMDKYLVISIILMTLLCLNHLIFSIIYK